MGDLLSLENRKWKVVGIFRAKRDPAESGALVRMEDFKEVSARGTYSYIEIKADSPKNIPKLTKYVNMAFGMLHDEFPDAPAIMALAGKTVLGQARSNVQDGHPGKQDQGRCTCCLCAPFYHEYFTQLPYEKSRRDSDIVQQRCLLTSE